MSGKQEIFISVDVETAGPVPGEFSMLSIGACSVFEPAKTFVCTLKPINLTLIPRRLKSAACRWTNSRRPGSTPQTQ